MTQLERLKAKNPGFVQGLSRNQLINHLLEAVREGHSIALSSPANFGKSSLLRKLPHFNADSSLLPIYIDLNLSAGDNPQAFYEVIFRNLLQPFLPESNPRLENFYQELSASETSPFVSARAFLVGLTELLTLVPGKVVLILDEFDQFQAKLPGQVFLQLRALYDQHPAKLSFVVATGLPFLAMGREEEEGVAEFYELFDPRYQLRLGGLTKAETETFAQKTVNLGIIPDHFFNNLHALTGGHPVLTQLLALELEPEITLEEWENRIRQSLEIRLELTRIWKSLAESEQQSLLQQLEGVRTLSVNSPLGTLEQRGLIVSESGQPQIFARVFEWYLLEKLEKLEAAPTTPNQGFKEIAYDPYREEVIFDQGKRHLNLGGNAAILFKYLYLRQTKPWCTKDELITAVWGNQAYSQENLDKLVSDLRQEIGDSEKRVIRTIARRGLLMVGVVEWREQRQ